MNWIKPGKNRVPNRPVNEDTTRDRGIEEKVPLMIGTCIHQTERIRPCAVRGLPRVPRRQGHLPFILAV